MTLVLIVDDNERNRKLVGDVLRAAGFATLEAETGGQGLTLAAERRPDVILMDLRLPDVDGVEVAQRLRSELQTASIPVVALSSLPLEGGGEWLEAAGFAGWLEKPIRVRDFPDQVRRYCAEADA
jgi:two-component system, cell cycle response regulator DivK